MHVNNTKVSEKEEKKNHHQQQKPFAYIALWKSSWYVLCVWYRRQQPFEFSFDATICFRLLGVKKMRSIKRWSQPSFHEVEPNDLHH